MGQNHFHVRCATSSPLDLSSLVQPNSATTNITYDAVRRPMSVTSPHGAVASYAYTNSPPTVTVTTNGRWTKTTMEGLGRTGGVEFTYDQNPFDGSYTENSWGRRSTAHYHVGEYAFTEMYSYTPGGLPTKKKLQLIYEPSWQTAELEGAWAYDNEGRPTTVTYPLAGETYKYDALGRLSAAWAPGPEWGQSYFYKGFGSRVGGVGSDSYGYDPENRWILNAAASEMYFWGVDGRKLGTYKLNWGPLRLQTLSENLHFAGRLIRSQGKWVVTDRLGSVIRSEAEMLRYFPLGPGAGNEHPGPAQIRHLPPRLLRPGLRLQPPLFLFPRAVPDAGSLQRRRQTQEPSEPESLLLPERPRESLRPLRTPGGLGERVSAPVATGRLGSGGRRGRPGPDGGGALHRRDGRRRRPRCRPGRRAPTGHRILNK